jgi:integrase
MSLTIKGVRGLMTRGETGRHFDRDGLYLVITGPTTGSWERRYQIRGKARAIGLGSARAFSLDEARERNRRVSQQLADGIDPLEAKAEQRAAQQAAAAAIRPIVSFKHMGERYIADKQAGWRWAGHGKQWKVTLARFVYPIIGDLDIRAVGTPEVLRVLEQQVDANAQGSAGKLWEARHVTARHVRNRIELILNYSMARGERERGFNPAAWTLLKDILPKKVRLVEHHPATPYAEMPAMMAALSKREGVAQQALRFLILTASRTKETLSATWDEIDFDNKVWTIPAARMKGGKEHKVPLSDAAVELLQSLYTEQGNPHLFIGQSRQRLSPAAMSAILHRLGRKESVHGFRSSFSTWAHEQTSHSAHTIEMALAHSVGTDVEKAYRRTTLFDKRRALMQQWAEYVTATPVEKAATDNVVSIGATR